MSTTNQVPFSQTLHVRDHCLCLAAQRAARALARQFDEAFRPFGITSGQFSLLMSLNRPDPPSLGAVAEVLAMDRTTLTANLKPLERKGLIVSRPNPRDRRSRLLLLTAEGHDVLGRVTPVWTREHARIDAQLGEGTPDLLRKSLSAIR